MRAGRACPLPCVRMLYPRQVGIQKSSGFGAISKMVSSSMGEIDVDVGSSLGIYLSCQLIHTSFSSLLLDV